MSTHEEDKRDGALRIWEALSGVDEELLAKSESKPVVIPFWKYGKAMVAGICVLFLGGLVLAMPQMDRKSANKSDCAAPEHVYTDGGRNDFSVNVSEQESVKEMYTEPAEEDNYMKDKTEYDGVPDKEAVTENDSEDELQIDNASGCVKDFRIMLKEEQARAVEVLGEYLPVELPEGYGFESAATTEGDGQEFADLLLLWSRGPEDIRWKVKRVDASKIACVDISETEKYDVHLYELPYAQTVPEEYREVFDAPIFRAEDLSLALIERRMKTIRDAGDTDTPRGHFGVLFEDGILVEFNGRATAQEVLNMFDKLLE